MEIGQSHTGKGSGSLCRNGPSSAAHKMDLTPFLIAGAMVVAAALGFITYAKAINNKFVYDDYPIILDNPAVNEPGRGIASG